MNKKKMNIILIPSVILIWILVLYRIFSLTGSVSNQPDQGALLSGTIDRNIFLYDTMDLLLNYRDPFGSVDYLFKEKIDFKPAPVIVKEEIKPREVPPPSVKYIGLVENSNRTSGIALTIINDRSRLLHEGDTLMGLKVKKINRDSIVVEFNKMPLKYLKLN